MNSIIRSQIFIQAKSLEELNAKLTKIPNNQGHISIHITTDGFRLPGLNINCTSKPLVKVDGTETFTFKIKNNDNLTTYFSSPFHANTSIPKNQLVEIHLKKTSQNVTLGIKAVERISINHLLKLTRADLNIKTIENLQTWILLSGFQEFNLCHQDTAIISNLNEIDDKTGRRNHETRIWEHRPDVQEAFQTITSTRYSDWLKNHGFQEYALPKTEFNTLTVQLPETVPFEYRPFGVNLIGYASSIIGIGEDLRTCREAFEMIGIPTATIDVPTQHTSNELREQAKTEADRLAPYAINLICMTAEEHARIFLELGYGIFSERYNIGYWPWELGNWPEPWNPLFGLVDEVWASSRHTYQSIRKELNHRPQPKLTYCPLGISPITPLTAEQKAKTRNKHGLPREAMLMICSFDGRSSFFRKNPWGAINAFLEAFPKDNGLDVGLVIKTIHAGVDSSEWNKLKELVKHDDRILVIDGALDRDELIQLYGCCDVLVSLHRAEGFGRILAECLLLGLNVVATNHSGNTDFCRGQHAHPVDYELTDVQDGDYPYHQNQQWAEPCCSHAAEILRNIYTKTSTEQYAKTPEGQATLRSYQKQLFIDSIAKHYVNQLKAIWNQSRHKTAEELNLRWSRQQCLYGMEES